MAEYIEREALIEEINSLQVTVTGLRVGKNVLSGYIEHYKNSVVKVINDQPTADVAEIKHGKWEAHEEHEDGYVHHRCSGCKEDAIFNYKEEPDYDEGCDGEWHYIGDIAVGISEQLSPYCPNCGSMMVGDNDENATF
jgi:hypothetical protein